MHRMVIQASVLWWRKKPKKPFRQHSPVTVTVLTAAVLHYKPLSGDSSQSSKLCTSITIVMLCALRHEVI